jgi:hypothetical protein
MTDERFFEYILEQIDKDEYFIILKHFDYENMRVHFAFTNYSNYYYSHSICFDEIINVTKYTQNIKLDSDTVNKIHKRFKKHNNLLLMNYLKKIYKIIIIRFSYVSF